MKTTKGILILSAFAASLFLISCDKAKDKVKVDVAFDMNVPALKVYVDTISHTGTVTLAQTSFTSNLQQTLNDNNASIADIESISIKSTEIKMLNPGSQNFNIINNMYAYLSGSGLAETRIAYIDPVPANSTQISLSSDEANVVDYLKQSTVGFRISGLTNGPNVQRDTLEVKLTFNIKAKVDPLD